MKKLLTILISSFLILHSSFAADEFDETLAQVDEYSRYCGLRLQQMEFSAPLLRSRLADCNTFIWYLWNDADAAKGNIEKFNIVDSINNIVKPARATPPLQ